MATEKYDLKDKRLCGPYDVLLPITRAGFFR